ncbi:MAG: NAD-dependent dehydratase, partial [Calothrix sp. SM1_5_4]|nr:NAD-dependent dehydratase [Calothrix sp. SM1_5_4]
MYKADRNNLLHSYLDHDWDAVIDFACFNDHQARATAEYFHSVKRYIFISTISVYDVGSDLREGNFDAGTYPLPAVQNELDYKEGKRRAEAFFLQHTPFPTVLVRFPVILGPDDYTRRLHFHIERVQRGQPCTSPTCGRGRDDPRPGRA